MKYLALFLLACAGDKRIGDITCFSGGVAVQRYRNCESHYTDATMRVVTCDGVGRVTLTPQNCLWVTP